MAIHLEIVLPLCARPEQLLCAPKRDASLSMPAKGRGGYVSISKFTLCVDIACSQRQLGRSEHVLAFWRRRQGDSRPRGCCDVVSLSAIASCLRRQVSSSSQGRPLRCGRCNSISISGGFASMHSSRKWTARWKPCLLLLGSIISAEVGLAARTPSGAARVVPASVLSSNSHRSCS